MSFRRRTFRVVLLASLLLLAGFAFGAFRDAREASAAISPAPCAGNVCTGTMVVGGQTMQYAFTEHLSPSGDLRIRLNGGVYNTNGLISTIAFGLPSFSTWDKLANPSNGAVYLPSEDVNPGRTAYERRDDDGCVGCIVDQVMSVHFSGLAPGAYTFSLSVVQLGDSGGKTLTFYVDAGAPSNANESTTWGGIVGMDFPCGDAIDNDIDFKADCADAQCAGSIGNIGSGAKCEQPEATCNDLFDNDADGMPDCLDSDCDGRVGQPAGTALCQYGNETGAATCADGFNNDGDIDPASGQPLTDCVDNAWSAVNGGNANSICWKKPAFGCPATETSCSNFVDDDKDQSYSDNWDIAPLTGGEIMAGGNLRCLDYDCAGDPACPAKENKTAANADADAQCFNGVDDDLDHLPDCADPDCKGVVNPGNPSQVCRDKEFDRGTVGMNGTAYQYCANGLDDNGDDLPGQPGSRTDCNDLSCKRQFGNCGPCPTREDFTFDSCADFTSAPVAPKDNDTDAAANCADADCVGKLGALGHAAMCAASENANDLCGDGFDNDNDGKIDCADSGCDGKTGPDGQTCQSTGESTGAMCGDGKDNDADGLIDCVDPNCWGVAGSSCAAKNWTDATCQTVPRDSAATAFTGNSPTVLASVRLATHVSQPDIIHLTGSGTYSSVTVIVGDNTDALKYYPYAANNPNCVISGPTAARFAFTSIAGHAVQIYNTPGADIATFDITLTCVVPATPATIKNYPISLSALKNPGAVAEYGDLNFSTTLYEATAPSVTGLETEGTVGGVVRVPYGGTPAAYSRRVRILPNDPATSSGICRCELVHNAITYQMGPDCVSPAFLFLSDASYVFGTKTEDGAGNESLTNNLLSPTFNVTPVIDSPLALSPSTPFFKAGQMQVDLSARFLTGASDTFNAGCEVFVRDSSGTTMAGPFGPMAFPAFIGMPVGNAINCSAQVTLPAGLSDGQYFLTVRVHDNDGDYLESNRKALYVCNSVPGPGGPQNGCQYADFDHDGTPEGLFTTPPLYSAQPLACDNCVGLANPLQEDTNANGIGDKCEPKAIYGRCEVDRDIVCSYDSDDAAHGCPEGELCCPGPSVAEDDPVGNPGHHKDPQACKQGWGICSIGQAICFADNECLTGGLLPGGFGQCQDNVTPCKRDLECAGLPGTAVCTGANVCDNLLYPWLQTLHGNIFSGKRITALDAPPQNEFNATFCISAKDVILNFSSELCGAGTTDATSSYERPKAANAYTSVLGTLDVAGLRAGKYGTVVSVAPGLLDATLASYAGGLDGRVFRVTGDATLSAATIRNGSGSAKGAGTVFVDGGNLTITGDVTYEVTSVTTLGQLASIGWVVTDDGSGTKGNIYVDGSVSVISGAFYAGGEDGFWSVAPPTTESATQLTVHGLAVAKKFILGRSYKSETEGSERFIYDGRAVVNPPPGFGDVTKSLPAFSDSLPQ